MPLKSKRKKSASSLNLSKARAKREALLGPFNKSESPTVPCPEGQFNNSENGLELKLPNEAEYNNSLSTVGDVNLLGKPKGKRGRKPKKLLEAGLTPELKEENGVNCEDKNGLPMSEQGMGRGSRSNTKRRSFYRGKLHQSGCEENVLSKPYSLIGNKALSSLLSRCVCEMCEDPLDHTVSDVCGLVDRVTLHCNTCGNSTDTLTTDKMVVPEEDSSNIYYDSLLRFVYSTLLSGNDYASLCDLLSCLEFPSVSELTYTKYSNYISNKLQNHCSKALAEAHSKVKEAHVALGNESIDDVLNISVILDGSWNNSGHASNFGYAYVVEVLTGLIVDYVILSKFCSQCSKQKSQLSESEFKLWLEAEHKDCQINFTSTSSSMEVEGTMILWKRSLQHGFRYLGFIGNEECFKTLSGESLYGDDYKVTEDNYIDHLLSKLSSALRKHAGDLMGESEIKSLSWYYEDAIKHNLTSIEKTKLEIEASLNHAMSTDATPQHEHCPIRWCFYQKALSDAVEPGMHADAQNVPVALKKEDVQQIQSVYDRLTCPELLKRCQGANQSLKEVNEAKIWGKCPKVSHYDRPRLEFAVCSMLIEYNKGYKERFLLAILEPKEQLHPIQPKKKRSLSDKREMQPRKVSAHNSYIENEDNEDLVDYLI